MLVGTYRPDGLSRRHPAAEVVPRLDRRHRVTHVHLDRLTPADVSGFLAAVFDQEPSFRAVDALHTRTGGNPFFLEELVSAAGEMPAGDGDAPLPWTVSELVSAELDDLDPDVRAMVRAAAVLGRRVSFDLLAAVTGASEADLIARLRVAVDGGLLVEGDPDLFGFHHELAREAVEAGLLGRERRRLHEAALAALRGAQSRDHLALTHHAQGAGRFDDMVAEARLGARESLALGSSYHLLAARALNNLTWHARQWNDVDEVRTLIDRMRVHARAAGFDSLAVTDVAGSLAELAAVEGDLDAAIAHLDAAHEAGTSRTGWTKPGWTAVFRAGLALEAGDLDVAELFTERAKPSTARTAMSVIGLDLHLACRRGDLDRARALLPDLIAVADHDGFISPLQVHDLVSAGLSAGLSVDEVRPLVERVGHYVGHRLDPDSPWRQLLGAQLAEVAGDVDAAIALYQAAAATLGAAPEILAGHRGTVHVGAAANLARAGRVDEARAHAAEAGRHLACWRGWRVDQLRAVERRLGLGDEPGGPEALTPREREVVALLAEGLTNAQVAERLYISPRTAAVHVSHVLSKLGMASRTEVAAWAVRTGAAHG